MTPSGSFSLIGCTVAPGFDYKDFELADKNWEPGN
ncbi:cupin domain-containing protein [Alphaproteobacteria bacterium]|nr:cupin domain-containing protein [Alphaproteobacteria bacterium]